MQTFGPHHIIRQSVRLRIAAWIACAAAGLAGCGGSDNGGGGSGPAPQNVAPTISGSPAGNVFAGAAYSFQPSAQDPENATLSFSIQNKPSWAAFSTATGALTGTPTVGNVGTTTGIVITVSDGINSTSLAAFSLSVSQAATASATVNWTAPTTNTDGSSLTDLAGFRIYYGTSITSLNSTVDAPGAATRTQTVASLVPGTYYFSVSAYSGSGVESVLSSPVTATVQ